MSVVRPPFAAPRAGSICLAACAAAVFAVAPAAAQVARLKPAEPAVEVVDPSERISGNATAGVVLVLVKEGDESGQEGDKIRKERHKIGKDRLWAFLSEPVPAALKLRISSIDGRYYAEVDYPIVPQQPGWVALDLSLPEFAFLQKNYNDPLNEIAALLSAADSPRFYPVRWGEPHTAGASVPDPPDDDDLLQIYLNTERAQAFVVVGGAPAYCREASAMSGFKFNAICQAHLGDLRLPRAADGKNVVEGVEVFRRSGVRQLAPLDLDLLIRY